MNKPVLLVEDSTVGLYLWVLMNAYVWNNTFSVRIANKKYISVEMNVTSFLQSGKLDKIDGVIPSAGSGLMSSCLYAFTPEDKVIGIMDAASEQYRKRINQCRQVSSQCGFLFADIRYNCASDILLSFKDFSQWCKDCKRFDRPEDQSALDVTLENMRIELIKGRVGKLLFDESIGLAQFASEHSKQCSFPDGKLSLERTLDYFFRVYTENSRLRSTKYRLSDCFCYDCGFLEYFCNRDDFLGKKLRDIYAHSILKPRMERVARKLGIELQFSSPESRPRVVVPKPRGTRLQPKSLDSDSIDLGIGLEDGTTPGDTESDTAISEDTATGVSEDTVTESEKDESEELTDLFGEEICV